MDNINEKFSNCNDPEEYVSLMFENTDKKTGTLCFHGLWHMEDGDEVYRFHMNWSQNDVDKLKADHKSLVESLTALSKIDPELTEDNAASLIKDEKLMNVWNTYVRPFTGDAEYTDEIDDILDKDDNIGLVEKIRQKMNAQEALDEYEKDFFEDCKDLKLTEEEEKVLDKYWNARIEEAERRVGRSRFALSLVICAQRLYKLLQMDSPRIIVENETRELITAMALHRYCDNQEEIE